MSEKIDVSCCERCKNFLRKTRSGGCYCDSCGYAPSMQDTFIRKLTEEEFDDERDEQRGRMYRERHRHVAPACCETMRRCKSIVILVSGVPDAKPYWYLRLSSSSHFDDIVEAEVAWSQAEHERWQAHVREHGESADATGFGLRFYPEPTHCPYCGAALPAIVRKAAVPEPLHKSDEYGDYCDVCEERSMNCCCWPPWAAWEPAS